MNATLLIVVAVLVVLALLVIRFGARMRSLDRRIERVGSGRSPNQIDLPPPGPIGKAIGYATLILVVLIILTVALRFFYESEIWDYVAGILFVVALLLDQIRRSLRLSGK